jgi:hypothetical protein
VAIANFSGHPTLAIAARAGRTRLIDNIRLDEEPDASIIGTSDRRHPRHGQ